MENLYALLTVVAVASLIGFALAVIFITEGALHEAEQQRKMADATAKRWDKFKQRHGIR